MMSVSGVNTGAAQPLTAAEQSPAQKAEERTRDRPLRPVMDEYVPEEAREPSGRYWVDRDEDGQPRIRFDHPGAEESDAKAPEQKDGGEERCIGSTDQVDREIEKLKKKRQELEQQLSTETDEARITDLERQLAQVERELKQKDNDTYRRQHTQVTRLS